jgi:hypothetical protein
MARKPKFKNDGFEAIQSNVVGMYRAETKATLRSFEVSCLKADIDLGLAAVDEGRLTDFDRSSIIALGRKLSAERASRRQPN